MRYELCSIDEYGSVLIHDSGSDHDGLIEKAKEMVSEENFDNPLTDDDRERNWECCFIEFFLEDDEIVENVTYSGKSSTGKHVAFYSESPDKLIPVEDIGHEIKVYIGTDHGVDYYAKNSNLKEINDVHDSAMNDKTIFFIRKSRG